MVARGTIINRESGLKGGNVELVRLRQPSAGGTKRAPYNFVKVRKRQTNCGAVE